MTTVRNSFFGKIDPPFEIVMRSEANHPNRHWLAQEFLAPLRKDRSRYRFHRS
jgi:hypothetical protein